MAVKMEREGAFQQSQLHWLDVVDRVWFGVCVLMFRCPEYLSTYCQPVSGISGRRHLRSADRGYLDFPRVKLASYRGRSFAYSGPSNWNSLPAHLWDNNLSLSSFKRHLKTFLFSLLLLLTLLFGWQEGHPACKTLHQWSLKYQVGGRVRLCSAHHGDLCMTSTRTEFGKRSFRVAAPRTWNSLLLHLHSPTISRQQFQSGLKTHLFKRAYIWLLPPRTIEEWTYLLTYLLTYFLTYLWGTQPNLSNLLKNRPTK